MRGKIRPAGLAVSTALALPHRIFMWVGRRVESGNPATTLDRFFRSQHVKDLRAIIVIALGALLVVFVVGLPLAFENELYKLNGPSEQAESPAAQSHTLAAGQARNTDAPPAAAPSETSKWRQIFVAIAWTVFVTLHVGIATLASFLTFFGPTLGVFGALVAWAYQTGSGRLGVVDLFACEISTLCRVITVVDAVAGMIKRQDLPASGAVTASSAPAAAESVPAARDFNSQEQYFPVFEGNTKDLQSLEARVVINITAFYTYMKTVRDSMRGRAGAQDVIYFLYLALESGRKAVDDLVEFEPEQAERILAVLISELKAYGFLREKFNRTDDVRHARLKLREPEYHDLVLRLTETVEAGKRGTNPAQWEPAALLLPEVRKRHADALAAAARATAIDTREVLSVQAAPLAPAAQIYEVGDRFIERPTTAPHRLD
jgi:hypothetical protein